MSDSVIKIERVGELYGVEQFEVEREGEGLYAVTLGYGSENADLYLQMTTEQLAELRDALDRELAHELTARDHFAEARRINAESGREFRRWLAESSAQMRERWGIGGDS